MTCDLGGTRVRRKTAIRTTAVGMQNRGRGRAFIDVEAETNRRVWKARSRVPQLRLEYKVHIGHLNGPPKLLPLRSIVDLYDQKAKYMLSSGRTSVPCGKQLRRSAVCSLPHSSAHLLNRHIETLGPRRGDPGIQIVQLGRAQRNSRILNFVDLQRGVGDGEGRVM